MAGYESQKFSMLDTIMELESTNKNRLLHSVIIVAQIDPKIDSVCAKITSHYESLFAKLQKRYQCDPPTGLLQLYSNFAFHFIEAHHTLIMHTIKDLQNCTFFTNSSIIQYLTNLKYAVLPLWKSAVIDIPPSGDESYQTSDTLEVVIGSVVRSLYKLISIYHKLPKTEALRFLDKIHERVDLVVPREKLEYLLKQNELLKPKDFASVVDKKHNTPLQSELAWPVPERLFHV